MKGWAWSTNEKQIPLNWWTLVTDTHTHIVLHWLPHKPWNTHTHSLIHTINVIKKILKKCLCVNSAFLCDLILLTYRCKPYVTQLSVHPWILGFLDWLLWSDITELDYGTLSTLSCICSLTTWAWRSKGSSEELVLAFHVNSRNWRASLPA